MDSLAANYASSDEDEDEKTPIPSCDIKAVNPVRTLFSSLPPPKSDLLPSPSFSSSSSIFSSLPPPKSASSSVSNSEIRTTSSTSSLFSSLPPPKTSSSSTASSVFSSLPPPKSISPASNSKPAKPVPPSQPAKRVVQFTSPIDPSVFKRVDDDDDEDDVRKRKGKPEEDLSSKPLSSIIPAPRNSAVLGSASSGRRSLIEANVPVGKPEPPPQAPLQSVEAQTVSSDYGSYYPNWAGGQEAGGHCGSGVSEPGASTGWDPSYGGYYQSYGSYDSSWDYGTMEASTTSEAPQIQEDLARIAGKRGRNEIPLEMIEVKQEELVKDRPREDQTKLTGIAFGPAYQPVSSQKGKPSKLHKRKHQIGALYFDLKQKEMELSERRSRGMLTKRETQGKYGW